MALKKKQESEANIFTIPSKKERFKILCGLNVSYNPPVHPRGTSTSESQQEPVDVSVGIPLLFPSRSFCLLFALKPPSLEDVSLMFIFLGSYYVDAITRFTRL